MMMMMMMTKNSCEPDKSGVIPCGRLKDNKFEKKTLKNYFVK